MQDKSNPKDLLGQTKYPMSLVPSTVLAELALAMFEGSRKYGAYNYRSIDIRMSIYYDAVFRHLISWFEGEDIDPDSGVHHVTKAISSLVVLRDGMINGKVIDDRPINSGNTSEHFQECNKKVKEVINKYPNCAPGFTRGNSENN